MSAASPRRARGRLLAFVVLQILVCVTLVLVGRYTALLSLRSTLAAVAEGQTMTTVPERVIVDGDFDAYLDPAAARQQIGDFTWSTPSVQTPFVGHGPRPGRSGNATINPWQCRSARPIRTPKPAGVLRVFTTGGSTLFGSGASADERTISGYLETALNAAPELDGVTCEVFALANIAWASTHERIAIENRISEFEPDLVISVSGLNDMHWSFLGRDVLWFRSYADDLYFQVFNQVLGLVGYPPQLDVAPATPEPVPVPEMTRRLRKNVRLAHHALIEDGVHYLFALQPILPVSGKPPTEREQSMRAGIGDGEIAYFEAGFEAVRQVLSTFEGSGFHFLDLTGVFDDTAVTEEVFLDPYHFGDRGNERIAAALARAAAPILAERR